MIRLIQVQITENNLLVPIGQFTRYNLSGELFFCWLVEIKKSVALPGRFINRADFNIVER